MEREPTQEELDAWLAEQVVKDRERRAARIAEAVKILEKWGEGDKPPRWFTDMERQLGARVTRIDLDDGHSFRRVAVRESRRVYNWRLAAKLIAEGADYWKVAHEIGCTVEAVQRRMREKSKLRRWVAIAHRERTERMEYVAARHGEQVVNALDTEFDHHRGDRDPGIKRWLLRRMLGQGPRDTVSVAPDAPQEVPSEQARISLNKPGRAKIGVDKPEQARIGLNKPAVEASPEGPTA